MTYCKYSFLTIIIAAALFSESVSSACEPVERKKFFAPFNRESTVKSVITDFVWDGLAINRNLFQWDSWKIITAFFPFYAIGRMTDVRIQEKFHDGHNHENRHQFDPFYYQCANYSLIVPGAIAAGALAFSRDEELRTTSWLFFVGLPSVYIVKKAVKELDLGKACERPCCEGFSRHKRAKNGFPSGHTAAIAYAAFLYGKRMGYKYAVPLGILTVGVGLSFTSCNRHYLSQLFAGAALGALYAYAADKVATKKMDCFNMSLETDCNGNPALALSCRF